MRISELAKLTQVPVETIRFYEREGPATSPAAHCGQLPRVRGGAPGERLSFIRHCRSLDMTLDEIRALSRFEDAPRDNCQKINEVLDKHLEQVARRIRELKQLQRKLRALWEQRHGVAEDCTILYGLKNVHVRPRTLGDASGGQSYPQSRKAAAFVGRMTRPALDTAWTASTRKDKSGRVRAPCRASCTSHLTCGGAP